MGIDETTGLSAETPSQEESCECLGIHGRHIEEEGNGARWYAMHCCKKMCECDFRRCTGGGHGHGPVPTNRCREIVTWCCWIVLPVAIVHNLQNISESHKCVWCLQICTVTCHCCCEKKV